MNYSKIKDFRNYYDNKDHTKDFKCGHCDKEVASSHFYPANISNIEGGRYVDYNSIPLIYICPKCIKPTFFDEDENQIPGVKYGSKFTILPKEVEEIYDECRKAYSVNAYTLSVMGCRKLLMNIAVTHGAETNKTFAFYIDWLEKNNYINSTIKPWVKHIKDIGNEANHEIEKIEKFTATQLIDFVEMLLKLIYEYPNKLNSN